MGHRLPGSGAAARILVISPDGDIRTTGHADGGPERARSRPFAYRGCTTRRYLTAGITVSTRSATQGPALRFRAGREGSRASALVIDLSTNAGWDHNLKRQSSQSDTGNDVEFDCDVRTPCELTTPASATAIGLPANPDLHPQPGVVIARREMHPGNGGPGQSTGARARGD